MELIPDDCVDFALEVLYRRRNTVDAMILRLEQQESDLAERVKGFTPSNLVSSN